ncbi:MAG TPA: DMT family transporter [Acidimicrobiia bacterium]|nr:DMT family transporter [Acidimicrobiia bacterium]
MEWLAILLAVAGGFTYALAAVIQQRVAAEQPPELSMSPRLLVALFRRPLWLLGSLLDVVAYGFEAAALGVGSVVLVGPLLVSGLLFAIPLANFGTDVRVTSREMVPAAMVTVGLAVFVGVTSPGGGESQASTTGWVLAGAFVGAVVVALTLAARFARSGGATALLLGLATGTLYGLTAVLTKSTVDLFGDGVLQTFTHWQPWALIVCSTAGLLLNQSAFQAGHVAASLPAISVVNPVLACVFGVTLFSEEFGANATWEWVVTAVAIVAMVWGTIRLSTSPLVAHEAEEIHHAPVP